VTRVSVAQQMAMERNLSGSADWPAASGLGVLPVAAVPLVEGTRRLRQAGLTLRPDREFSTGGLGFTTSLGGQADGGVFPRARPLRLPVCGGWGCSCGEAASVDLWW